jgi:hypothetical protein
MAVYLYTGVLNYETVRHTFGANEDKIKLESLEIVKCMERKISLCV